MSQSDVTIKQFNGGKFNGKFAAFFNTEKAKEVLRNLGSTDENHIIAGDQINIPRVEALCERSKLHYEHLILNL